MSDLALRQQADGSFDLEIEKGDLAADEGLRTAILLSLFCDARATRAELPPGEEKRRGWWGDSVADTDGDQVGSKLWLLAREKQTVETLERAREYAEESLAWLLEDAVAESVGVSTSYPARGILRLDIEVTRPGKETAALSFDYAWDAEAKAK